MRFRKERVRAAQDEVVGVLNQIGELRGEEERTSARIESIEDRLGRFDVEDQSALEEKREAESLVKLLGEEIEAAKGALSVRRSEFSDGQEEKRKLRSSIDELTETISLAREERNSRFGSVGASRGSCREL